MIFTQNRKKIFFLFLKNKNLPEKTGTLSPWPSNPQNHWTSYSAPGKLLPLCTGQVQLLQTGNITHDKTYGTHRSSCSCRCSFIKFVIFYHTSLSKSKLHSNSVRVPVHSVPAAQWLCLVRPVFPRSFCTGRRSARFLCRHAPLG